MRRMNRLTAAFAALAAGLVVPSAASAVTYEYDALGRVVKVTYDNGAVVEYQYDAAGNRVVVTQDAN